MAVQDDDDDPSAAAAVCEADVTYDGSDSME